MAEIDRRSLALEQVEGFHHFSSNQISANVPEVTNTIKLSWEQCADVIAGESTVAFLFSGLWSPNFRCLASSFCTR